MSTFTAAELLALSPPDLYSLLELCEGDSPVQRAAALGLDCSDPVHREAVERACTPSVERAQAFSPPIGAAHRGVRSDLTPAEQTPADPGTAEGGGYAEALSLPEPDPEGARGMAELLAAAAGTGEPFMAGTFALYADPSGAVVMVTETAATGVRRDVIPRKAVRFALGLMGGGKSRGMLGRLIGG
jgi:hypothetical protein